MNTKKISRIVQIKQRTVDAAEAAHAAAHHASIQADAERAAADRKWLAAVHASQAVGVVGTIDDLADQDAQIRFLRRKIDEAEHTYLIARTNEAVAREAMTEARIELRRFETWLEKATAAAQEERKRIERGAEDEVAQRKVANG